jgi:hypothetical protein
MVNFNELYKRGTKLTISEIEKAMHEINNRQGMDNLIDYAKLGGRQVQKIYVLCGYDIQGETYFQLYETDLNGLTHIKQAISSLFPYTSSIPQPIYKELVDFVSSVKRKKHIKTAFWLASNGYGNRFAVYAIKGGLSG